MAGERQSRSQAAFLQPRTPQPPLRQKHFLCLYGRGSSQHLCVLASVTLRASHGLSASLGLLVHCFNSRKSSPHPTAASTTEHTEKRKCGACIMTWIRAATAGHYPESQQTATGMFRLSQASDAQGLLLESQLSQFLSTSNSLCAHHLLW